MQYTIKYFFSCIFLCVTISNSTAVGFSKADSLFTNGNYFEASIEYERQIFEARTLSTIPYLRYKKALCYKHVRDFERAVSELEQVYFTNANDTLYPLTVYEHALCLYLDDQPQKALWKIDEYMHFAHDSIHYAYLLPLKIISLNATMQWEKAKSEFNTLINIINKEKTECSVAEQKIEELYSKKNLPRIKERKKAENWSRFIPGSGQMYAGAAGEGALNFLIQASLLTLSAHQFLNGFYFTGYLAGLGFLNKVYQGGIVRAGNLAHTNTQKQLSQFNYEATLLLMDIQREQIHAE